VSCPNVYTLLIHANSCQHPLYPGYLFPRFLNTEALVKAHSNRAVLRLNQLCPKSLRVISAWRDADPRKEIFNLFTAYLLTPSYPLKHRLLRHLILVTLDVSTPLRQITIQSSRSSEPGYAPNRSNPHIFRRPQIQSHVPRKVGSLRVKTP
jgi:hypothetical protein